MASGIMGLGDTALATSGDVAGNAAIQDSARQMVGQNIDAVMPSGAALPAGTTGQISNITDAGSALQSGTITPDQYSNLASQYSSAYAPAAAGNSFAAGIQSGNLVSYAMAHPGQTAAVALPLLGSALTKNPTLTPPAQASNYGQPLQRISPDFKGTFPAQPSPAYQAHYPNYVQNPYNPASTTASPTTMAEGGVANSNSPLENMATGGSTGMFPQSQMTSPQYATPTQMPTGAQAVAADYDTKTNPMTGDILPQGFAGGGAIAFSSGNLVDKYNGSQYDPRSYMGANNPYDPRSYMQKPEQAPVNPRDLSVVTDSDPATANLDAFSSALVRQGKIEAAAKMPTAGIKAARPTPKTLSSGLTTDPYMAQVAAAQQAQAQQAATQMPEIGAAHGGIIGMAAGGSTPQVYKPSYQNYQQAPFQQATQNPAQLQANTQAYIQQSIPTPTRNVMSTTPGQSTAGHAIDPLLMQGSPAYLKAQADAAAAAALQTPTAYDQNAGGGGAAQGGIIGYAGGGMPSLGGYSDGGHLLKGPGDGMSDSIPAQIGAKQPARLADGEFVIPADVVSHLGNGSTEAGAKHLYAMMDKIRAARTGRKKQAPQVNATKYLPK
jgi:hypothetical protein